MTKCDTHIYDALIIGAGLVGLTTALALSHKGLKTALIDRADPVKALAPDFDGRASALSASSVTLLSNLGLLPDIQAQLQPMNHIVVADGKVGAVSPLTLDFDRNSLETSNVGTLQNGVSGYMVENKYLRMALYDAVFASTDIDFWAPNTVKTLKRDEKGVSVTLETGTHLTGAVLIAADGRTSYTRRNAGIEVETKSYSQSALTVTLSHSRNHQNTAYEIFYPSGPFALLPLKGRCSSLVWSDKPATLRAALSLPRAALIEEIARRTNGLIGEIDLKTEPLLYPLSLQIAHSYTASRLALVGDAAHVIHPIAGQGLNMGLRDVGALVDILSEAKSAGLDIGGASLEAYGVWRNFDTRSLAGATDILNSMFSNRLAPLVHARRIGLTAIQGSSVLKSFFMREAAGQSGVRPSLMRASL